jgi:lipoprotein-anchoring transpeptidase ErfK/SrfK
MKSFSNRHLTTLATATMLIFSGCVTSQTDNRERISGPVIPAASPSPSAKPDVATNQLTLPVLDALLQDDSFISALKSQLSLSEEQIASLKSLSAGEVDRLRKSNAEDSEVDPSQVRVEAVRKVSAVIGQEKTNQLSALINEHWANSDEQANSATHNAEMSDTPSAVPTDTRVVVNIPAYRMDLFEDGRLIKTYKIGIGYPEFPLPQGLRKAQSIIINPTWTPPDSPWVDNSKVTPGETVEPGSKLNPLGPVKIPIGMPSLIHGGKAVAKLGSFASHGCVGLTNTQVKDFATRLAEASDTEIAATLLDSYYKEKTRTRVVKLKETVPVELRYQTIVVENGAVHIYKDVYAEQTNTKEKLEEVLNAFGVKFDDLSEDEKNQLLDGLQFMSPGAQRNPEPSPEQQDTKNAAKKSREKTAKKPRNNKEVVVSLSSLAQKGYPEPVELDSGNGPTKLAATVKPSGRN